MAFGCPQCGGRESLKIMKSLELPQDNRSDEITLQTAACDACGFLAIAVYEESRRGSLHQETFHHTGYPVSSEVYAELTASIRACNSPRSPGCACASHTRFSRQDSTERWAGLDDLHLGREFELVYRP